MQPKFKPEMLLYESMAVLAIDILLGKIIYHLYTPRMEKNAGKGLWE